jgi:hypothetical protein
MTPQAVRTTPAADLASPSLCLTTNGVPAYELKFLLSEDQARDVEAWARRHLARDAHADPALGGAYRTTSLYCDTPDWDVYRRVGSHRRRKFRLRRYGQEARVFLERKAKAGDRVRKRRTDVPEAELARLAHPFAVLGWPGDWFHRRLLARRLRPTCRVGYERTAYVGAGPDGPLRLTLDRHLRGAPADAWSLALPEDGRPLPAGGVICEFKYRLALPALFKGLIQEMGLSPRPVSKYRLCVQACAGLPAEGSADA